MHAYFVILYYCQQRLIGHKENHFIKQSCVLLWWNINVHWLTFCRCVHQLNFWLTFSTLLYHLVASGRLLLEFAYWRFNKKFCFVKTPELEEIFFDIYNHIFELKVPSLSKVLLSDDRNFNETNMTILNVTIKAHCYCYFSYSFCYCFKLLCLCDIKSYTIPWNSILFHSFADIFYCCCKLFML